MSAELIPCGRGSEAGRTAATAQLSVAVSLVETPEPLTGRIRGGFASRAAHARRQRPVLRAAGQVIVADEPLAHPRLRGVADSVTRDHERVLVACASEAEPCPLGNRGPTALLVGPEGGLLDEELGLLARAGARTVSLGPRTLRVEHAVVALLSHLAF